MVFDRSGIGQLFDNRVHHRTAHFLVSHLPAPESDRHLRFISVGQEFLDLPDLDLQIVFVGARPQLDLFDLRGFLMSPALVLFLTELVLVFSIVHDPADWRSRRRGHFDEVIAHFLGLPERVRGGQDAQLLAIRTDDAHLANPNFPINTQFGDDTTPPR